MSADAGGGKVNPTRDVDRRRGILLYRVDKVTHHIIFGSAVPTGACLGGGIRINGQTVDVGYSVVLYLVALQSVPESFYESAMIDGANGWDKFWHITLPIISRTTFFIIVLSVIGSFQAFDQIYVLTQGGPARATSVIVHYLYENGFQWFNMGYAAAIAYVLFALLFIMTIIQWTYRARWVYGEE